LQLCADILDTWRPGLPIGNLTSQLWANVYLHELDKLAKRRLGIKRYIRYMDDFVVIHHDRAYLHGLRLMIEDWLQQTLKLRLNNKTQVFPVSLHHGRALDFLGYRIWPTHRRLRNDSVKRMAKVLRQMQRAYSAGRVDREDVYQRIQSWLAHASYADTYRIRSKLMARAVFKRHSTDD